MIQKSTSGYIKIIGNQDLEEISSTLIFIIALFPKAMIIETI